jgi:DNA-binding transcriptional LysR family regulator
METARCRAFLASAETGSFTKAADMLGYTPSGVSQLVNALEEDLGVPLLSRSTRGVALTADGERFLPAVREFLSGEDALYQLASGIKGLEVGSVNIASYSSISTHWLPEIIGAFQREHPGIKISLLEGIRQEVMEWMGSRRADVAFVSWRDPMEYEWIPLAEDRMLAVLPRSHPLAGAEAYPLSRVPQEDFIMPALGRDDDVADLLDRHAIRPNIKFTTREDFSAMEMISQGLGMTVLNELITKGWDCGAVLLPVDPPESITLGIALPSLSAASPAVKRFVEYAAKRLTKAQKQTGV